MKIRKTGQIAKNRKAVLAKVIKSQGIAARIKAAKDIALASAEADDEDKNDGSAPKLILTGSQTSSQ